MKNYLLLSAVAIGLSFFGVTADPVADPNPDPVADPQAGFYGAIQTGVAKRDLNKRTISPNGQCGLVYGGYGNGYTCPSGVGRPCCSFNVSILSPFLFSS